MEAAQAQRRAEIEEADAEYEAESARKAAAWQQMAQANEQALNDSIAATAGYHVAHTGPTS